MGEKMDTLFSKFMIFFIALFGLLFLFSLLGFINNFITYDYSFSENLKSFNENEAIDKTVLKYKKTDYYYENVYADFVKQLKGVK